MNKLVLNAFIPGEPKTWERAQAFGARRFNSKKMKRAQANLAWSLRAAAPGIRVEEHARFGVQLEFYISKKGDGDNYEKLVLDALTGVVWEDDDQIFESQWKKISTVGFPGDFAKHLKPGIHLIVYRIEGL